MNDASDAVRRLARAPESVPRGRVSLPGWVGLLLLLVLVVDGCRQDPTPPGRPRSPAPAADGGILVDARSAGSSVAPRPRDASAPPTFRDAPETIAAASGSGLFVTPGPRALPKVQWKVAAGTTWPTRPVVSEGVLVLGTMGLGLTARDVRTGALLWKHAPDLDAYERQGFHPKMCEPGVTPAIASGVVYHANCVGEVSALELRTGRRLWQVKVPGGVITPTIVSADRVLAVTTRVWSQRTVPHLLALDRTSGQQVWSVPVLEHTRVVVGAGRAFVRREGGLCALDLLSGRPLWQQAGANDPVAVIDDLVVALAPGGYRVLAAATGALGVLIPVRPGPSVVAPPVLVVWEQEKRQLSAYGLERGERVWQRPHTYLERTGLTAAAGVLYVNEIAKLRAIDLASGQVLWSHDHGPQPPGTDAVPDRGALYYGTRDDHLWSLR